MARRVEFVELDRFSVIEAGGHRLETLQIPSSGSDQTVLVFLHEGLGSTNMWKGFPQELCSRTGCAGLVYSRYGNGFSEVLGESRGVRYMHDEAQRSLPNVLQTMGIADAILIGHSDGASIALIYAAQPAQTVRGLVLEAPHVFVEDRSIEGIRAAKRAFESGDLPARLAPYHADVRRTFYGWNDIWLDPAFRSWNIVDALPYVNAPMFAIAGAMDEYGTFSQIEALLQRCTGPVDALYLADCAHVPHRQRPALVLDAAASFVRSLL